MNLVILELSFAALLLGHGVWRGFQALRPQDPRHLVYLLLSATSLTFGAGPFISFLYGGFRLPEEQVWSLNAAYAGVALFLLGGEFVAILVFRWRAGPKPGVSPRREEAGTGIWRMPRLGTMIALYALVLATRAYFALEYGILFSGSATSARSAAITYPAVVATQFAPIVGAACLLYAFLVVWSKVNLDRRLSVLAIIVLECAWLATQGRRSMIEGLVIGLMAYLYAGNRIRPRAIAAVSGVALGLWFFVFPAFLAVRSELAASGSNYEGAAAPIPLDPSFDASLAKELHAENSVTRPLIVRFVVHIAEDEQRLPVMYGRAFAASIYLAMPAPLMQGKGSARAPESLIQAHFGQPDIDTSTTWPAVGMADFGLPGAFGAGVVFSMMLALSNLLINALQFKSPVTSLALRAFLIHSCVFVEECPSSLWAGLRDIALLWVACWIMAVVVQSRASRSTSDASACGLVRKGGGAW